MEAQQSKAFGLIDKADGGNAHQLQLWFEAAAGGWRWTVRNAFMPGGKMVRSCVLDSGTDADEDTARRLGQESFDRNKQPSGSAQAA